MAAFQLIHVDSSPSDRFTATNVEATLKASNVNGKKVIFFLNRFATSTLREMLKVEYRMGWGKIRLSSS